MARPAVLGPIQLAALIVFCTWPANVAPRVGIYYLCNAHGAITLLTSWWLDSGCDGMGQLRAVTTSLMVSIGVVCWMSGPINLCLFYNQVEIVVVHFLQPGLD
jgi:hypothetical protein